MYLAVVIDLFSRQVVGWSMQSQMHVDLVLNAVTMAVWRRKPQNQVIYTLIRAVNIRVVIGRTF